MNIRLFSIALLLSALPLLTFAEGGQNQRNTKLVSTHCSSKDRLIY